MTATPNLEGLDPSRRLHPEDVDPPAAKSGRRAWILAILLGLLATFAWSWWSFDIRLVEFEGVGQRLGYFAHGLAPPDLSVVETVALSTLETLKIAYVGTVSSALLALAAGRLAAAGRTPAWLRQPVTWLLAVMGGVPLILVALVCVIAVGFGPLAGVIAITVHATGKLGRAFAESFEKTDPRRPEAPKGIPAGKAETIRPAALVEVAPDLLRATLLRFERNVRECMLLGLVGAGGIGFHIQMYARAFQYDKAATLIAVVLLLVVLIEQITGWCRRRLG